MTRIALPGALCTTVLIGTLSFAGPGVGRSLASDVEVYVTREQAPRLLFPEATAVVKKRITLEADMREKISDRIAPVRPSLWEPVIVTYVLKRENEVIGYAVIINEIGKHRPITFVVGVDTAGAVRGVEIMIYREAVGGEVRMRRFLKQYEGKTISEPIRTGRDITNISGATLSVRAVNRGLKKALAFIELVYGVPTQPAPGATALAPK